MLEIAEILQECEDPEVRRRAERLKRIAQYYKKKYSPAFGWKTSLLLLLFSFFMLYLLWIHGMLPGPELP